MTTNNVLEKLDELDYLAKELRQLQSDKESCQAALTELVIDAGAYECFTLNLNKVRRYFSPAEFKPQRR